MHQGFKLLDESVGVVLQIDYSEGSEQRSEVLTQLLSRQTSCWAHEVPLAAYNYAVSGGQRHG